MEWPPNNIMHDEPLYIREIQNWLRALAFSDERIPLIAVDGIYGPETTQAVRAFQEITGLPATGTVDKATWDAVYIAFVAATLVISESTVRTHVKSIYKKLGVNGREELLAKVDEG